MTAAISTTTVNTCLLLVFTPTSPVAVKGCIGKDARSSYLSKPQHMAVGNQHIHRTVGGRDGHLLNQLHVQREPADKGPNFR
jgi:hypothetical protein